MSQFRTPFADSLLLPHNGAEKRFQNNNRTFEMSSVECWRKRRMSWMISSMSKWKLVSNWRRTLRSRRRCWSMTPQTPPSVESSFRRTICSSGTSKKASEDDGDEDGSSVRACLTSIKLLEVGEVDVEQMRTHDEDGRHSTVRFLGQCGFESHVPYLERRELTGRNFTDRF